MTYRSIALAVSLALCASSAKAADAVELKPIDYTKETLDNGLRVIYVPMHNAPVVHVRVLYHVGSRDEQANRQGFAHMFEHMMFRGSAHVAPEQHMKMIGEVGGDSNAFTDFDQTCYTNTIPAEDTEMALYLEADRMASFKVSDDIFKTERKVVSEEWRMRTANPPYGQLDLDFYKLVYNMHSYRWTPIGDMDQLRQAKSSELQSFFNKYYVPDNACLIVSGDIDVDQTKQWVKKYFGWIPESADKGKLQRDISNEPEQTEARHFVVHKNVPLPTAMMGWKTASYTSDDHYALSVLADVLTRGRTSRLSSLLVNSDKPECASVNASDGKLEDVSTFDVTARLLPGNDSAHVQQVINDAIDAIKAKGVTNEELDRVKTGQRIGLIRGRETCEQVAARLGEEEVFGDDAAHANEELAKLEAVTSDDVVRVAKKYLDAQKINVVEYLPDPTGKMSRQAASTQAATQSAKAEATAAAPVQPSEAAIQPRVKDFPRGYPTAPPTVEAKKTPGFAKGDEATVAGVKLIAMTDHRLPMVNVSLIMRTGGHFLPAEKTGVAQMAANMLRLGAAGKSFAEFSEDIESRGISISASDGGDNTRLTISCTSDQLDHAIDKAHDALTKPNFDEVEFTKSKRQMIAGVMASLANGSTVAQRELAMAVWGDSPLGHQSSPESLGAISLDDVKQYYNQVYHTNDAILVFNGDITIDRAKELAAKLLDGVGPAKEYPSATYTPAKPVTQLKIILIDNPDAKQSSIRMAAQAYDVHDDADKFSGQIATGMLSGGIESRLGRYVRAEKGFTYGVNGWFLPGRHGGLFNVSVDTNPDTTAPCIEACFKVLNDMASGTAPITDTELADAKRRAIGSLVMDTQTIAAQSNRRVEALLNGFPIDYYDQLPAKLRAIDAAQTKDVVAKYVKDSVMTVVVVGPGSQIKEQLDKLGPVEVKPMPASRKAKGSGGGEMMK